MKKILIFLITLFLSIQTVLASNITTYERTEADYLVPPDIKVTSSNKQHILSTPAIDAKEKIYDFADLLTDSEEEMLYEKLKSSIEHTNYDLAVVTINKNNKNSAEAYADDFFDYNYFGINSSRDGLLILIDMDNRIVYISTSGYAIKMYNDNRIDGIIDAGYNYLKSGKYYECLTKMIAKVDSYYNNGYPSGNNDIIIDKNGNAHIRIPYLMIIFICGIVSLITSLILYYKTLSKIKKQNTATYINPEMTNINKNDQFVTTHTSRIKIDHSSGSSGGGGGSSFHSSSSGRSHGGGGRHF